jgi:hypothetical protein
VLKLTDVQMHELTRAAKNVPHELRDAFLRRIGNSLSGRTINDATLHIAINSALRAMSPMRRGSFTFGPRGRPRFNYSSNDGDVAMYLLTPGLIKFKNLSFQLKLNTKPIDLLLIHFHLRFNK